MTRPRNDSERQRICNKLAATFGHLCTAPTTISRLRVAIEARMDDGIKAATYDGDGRTSDTDWTPVERAALLRRGDAAHDDAVELDNLLEQAAHIEERIWGLMQRYPMHDGKRHGEPPIGTGACPSGCCRDHWAAGMKVKAAKGRYRDHCRLCGERYAETGTPWAPEVLRYAEEYGWASWRTARAIETTMPRATA